MNKLFFMLLLLSTVGCSVVDQGQGGIVTGINGEISSELRTGGFEVVLWDSMETIDLTQNIVNLDNVSARDSDNIPLSELDAKVTFDTNPNEVINFYRKTKSITDIKDENGNKNTVLGYAIIRNEAVNILQKSISKFKSKDITSNRNDIEKDLKGMLQESLDTRFGKVFNIVDVNINKISLNAEIEKSLQLVQVTRNQQLEIEAQTAQVNSRKQLLDAEMRAKAEVANRYGLTVREYLELEIKREFNKALEKSGSNVQLHLEK